MNAVTRAAASETRTGAWRIPDFRRLWFASSVSWFGAEIGELAIPLLAVLTLSASAGEVGILRAAQFLPFLLATLPLGLLVDRHRRRPLMITADAGRCLLLLTIPVAVWAEVARMPWLYLVVFACGVLTVLHHLADFALLPRIVPQPELVDANGKLSASQSATEIGGKGAGGVLVQGAGLGGLLASALGYHTAMVIGAFTIPLATLWVAFSPIPRLATIEEAVPRPG
ncbi:MAG TPA: MFS transporter [Natronosporangium sp.]